MNNSTGFKLSAAVLATALSSLTLSGSDFIDNVQVRGFVSQGYLQSWSNNYPVEAEDGTFDFREVAINANYASGSFRFGAQVFAQSLGNYGEDDPILDWAVADYNFRREIGIRAGRLKFARGLHGEALDVDAIRPFVFLPSGIYNPILRDFNSSVDGAMLYGSLDAGDAGSFDYKLFYGSMDLSAEQGAADFFNDTSIFAPSGIDELEVDTVPGLTLFWNTPVDGLRVGYSYSELRKFYGEGPLGAMPVVDAQLHFEKYPTQILSAEYFVGDWTFNAEYSISDFDYELQSPFGSNPGSGRTDAWYVSAARRLGAKWEVGTYYSVSENKNPAPETPKEFTYTHDWALSLRFDATDRLVLKLENHFVEGTSSVFNTPRTPNPDEATNYGFFAAKATYNF